MATKKSAKTTVKPKVAPKAPAKKPAAKTQHPAGPPRRVLVTGAGGYIGSLLVKELAGAGGLDLLLAADVRPIPPDRQSAGAQAITLDIRDPDLKNILRENKIEAVVHLAAIVTPPKKSNPQLEYEVDVLGTQNVLGACVAAGVRQFICTSSGAAYGYHADNAPLLTEDCPLRGNDEFPYSRHKRLVEEMLADYRQKHPALKQLIFRPGTILGRGTKNQITKLFEGPFVLGLEDAASPFVIIWDQDVVACLKKGLMEGREGIYNLAGDGVLTMKEMAWLMGKPFVGVPSAVMEKLLGALKPLGLSPYGPEQVRFLRYRPVLGNDKLKREFGYTPRLSTREVFAEYRRGN